MAAWLSDDSPLGFYWWIYIAFGFWALIEISPLRASPGKWIAGLVVRSMDGEPASFRKRLIRQLPFLTLTVIWMPYWFGTIDESLRAGLGGCRSQRLLRSG